MNRIYGEVQISDGRCIDTSDSESMRIFQDFSRSDSTRKKNRNIFSCFPDSFQASPRKQKETRENSNSEATATVVEDVVDGEILPLSPY